MKTLAIRLDDELHAQLTLIAGLEGENITDIIRGSIQAYVEARKVALAGKAEAALAEIEREAASKRQAIAALFSDQGGTTTKEPEQALTKAEDPATPGRSGRAQRGGSSS